MALNGCLAGFALMFAATCVASLAAAPFDVAPLFDPAKPDLGLRRAPGAENVVVFAPTEKTDKFSNGVVLFPFRGKLYAQWQSSARDEDSVDTWVAYAVSSDGTHWSKPKVLVPAGRGPAMHSSGGWWSDGKTLVVFINVWPEGFVKADGSHPGGHTEYMTSRDGVHWSARKKVTGVDGKPIDGIIEQDPHALPSGRIVTAFHLRPGMIVAPFYTGDPLGVSGWARGKMENLPHEGNVSREIEPSVFLSGPCLTMAFRDQAESFKVLAAQSCDDGATWTTPELTAMPDARAKLSAGNLPDGTAFLVNAPSGNKTRIPLAIGLSRDGKIFDRAYLLRGTADLPPLRYPGRYKRPGYHYPKSVVWNGYLYVGYAANKEDVAVTRVPLSSLIGQP
jgi:hypothetical protein